MRSRRRRSYRYARNEKKSKRRRRTIESATVEIFLKLWAFDGLKLRSLKILNACHTRAQN